MYINDVAYIYMQLLYAEYMYMYVYSDVILVPGVVSNVYSFVSSWSLLYSERQIKEFTSTVIIWNNYYYETRLKL